MITITGNEQYEDIVINFGTKKPLKFIINMYYNGII